MILRPNPIPSSRLTVARETIELDGLRTLLVAEMSDVGGLGRVYDDACDLGLTVIGQRREVVFVVEREQRDAEGELLWEDLIPANLADRREVRMAVRLFND
jgi:hypothetical protein